MSKPLTITLGHHPTSRAALAPGRAARHGLDLTEVVTDPMHDAFSPMIREQRFDISELAIVSAMQAVAYDKPLILLPVTLAARFQHKCIVRNLARDPFGPEGLAGRRVGVRAYTQTTSAWVRTILQHEYGIAPLSMRWLTQKGAHVAEFRDPPHVEHADPGDSLLGMLEEGTIDAAIFGNDLPDLPWIAPVIDDPDRAARAGFARTGIIPINHIVAISARVVDENPDVPGQLMALFRDARDSVGGSADADLYPVGMEAMAPSVGALLSSAYDQGLLSKPMDVETLFAPARSILGRDLD